MAVVQLESYLERLLPKVFLKISDPKEATRAAAVSVLESMRVVYNCEVLLPLLLKTLEHTNTKVRLSCIDFLHYLIENCAPEAAPYLSSQLHMKSFVVRLTPLVTDKNAALRKLAARTLAQLHGLHTDNFLGGMAGLSLALQTNAKRAMEAHVSGLDAALAAYIRGGQVQQPPATASQGASWKTERERAPAAAAYRDADETLTESDDEEEELELGEHRQPPPPRHGQRMMQPQPQPQPQPSQQPSQQPPPLQPRPNSDSSSEDEGGQGYPAREEERPTAAGRKPQASTVCTHGLSLSLCALVACVQLYA